MKTSNIKGFTLLEVMVASSLSLLITIAIFTVFVMVNKITTGGNRQVNYDDMARKAQGKIISIIEGSRACSVQNPTTLTLMTPAAGGVLVQGSLTYVDADNKRSTVSNNYIVYVPDISVTGNAQIITYYVSPLDGTNVFKTLNISPATVGVSLHIGDVTNTPGAGLLNTGYQGIVLQFSATPRNLQWWYSL